MCEDFLILNSIARLGHCSVNNSAFIWISAACFRIQNWSNSDSSFLASRTESTLNSSRVCVLFLLGWMLGLNQAWDFFSSALFVLAVYLYIYRDL